MMKLGRFNKTTVTAFISAVSFALVVFYPDIFTDVKAKAVEGVLLTLAVFFTPNSSNSNGGMPNA